MRIFLYELSEPLTMDEVKAEYAADAARLARDEGIENFARYLDLCMWWNNGALSEVLTDDTPRECRARAVSYYRVICSNIAGDEFALWATEKHAARLREHGYTVMPAKNFDIVG